MPFKKRVLLGSLVVLFAALLAICFSPVIVANALRLWISWKARQAKLVVTIDKIDAPFLHPVQLHGVRVTSASDSAFRINLAAARATLELNLRAALLRMRGRAIQNLALEGVHAEVRRNHVGTPISEAGWKTFQHLLPSGFKLDSLDLRVEDGATVVLLRGASLSGSEVEAGHFRAGEIMISSPWLRQTFSDLRGATHWESDRLTIAGITLTHGLDVERIAADLSHLSRQHLGIEFDGAIFGGKIRADISNEWHSDQSTWNVVGSAADVSLAQTSEAIGLADHAKGVLHACKFTFRGNPRDMLGATASLWAEVAGLEWRDRFAETIMLGAALYNRQVQLQQLYLKQSENELTLSGEGGFGTSQTGWLNPVFRGDISASIGNLGEFAGLFGADPDDFAGEIAIDGTMNARDRKIGSHLTASGKNLSIFKSPIDSFAAKLNLKATELEIEQLELHHGKDFARATGKIDVAHEHEYSGTASFMAANIAEYIRLVSSPWSSTVRQGTVNCDWSGNGNTNFHTGTFHLNGGGIIVSTPAELLPFDAELEGTYSPASIFFRQLHLANQHASLNGFLTIAQKYLQVQALALDLNGKPQLRGNVFVPIALSKIGRDQSLLRALDPDQKLDFDLNLEPTDLTEFSRALIGRPALTGNFGGRFSIFGGLNALQGWGEAQLRDFALESDRAIVSADLQGRLTAGTVNMKAGLQFRDSGPIMCDVSAPIHFGQAANGGAAQTINASVSFPKILFERVPRYLARYLFREGTLSGRLAVSETFQHPKILGDIQLIKIKVDSTLLQAAAASARISFKGTTGSIDAADLGTNEVNLPFRGEIDFADTNAISMRLWPTQPIADLTPRETTDCISGIKMLPVLADQPATSQTSEIIFNGSVNGNWRITLNESQNGEPSTSSNQTNFNRTFPLCFGNESVDKTLLLGCEPIRPPEKVRPRKRPKRP